MDLDDLNYESISDLSVDEGIEKLRQIRLSRRVPVKTKKNPTPKKPVGVEQVMSANEAAEILKILGG